MNEDPRATAIVAFLESEGGAALAHAGRRTLLDHLCGTYSILRRWGAPAWLQHAALIHSLYGTEAYAPQLVSSSRRDEVAAVAGAQAERLAYLFSVTPRGPLFAGTHLWARDLPTRGHDAQGQPSRDELDGLVLLHMANIAEQARGRDGSPGRWLARIRDLAELLVDSNSVTPPLFAARLAGFSEADESLARRLYVRGGREESEAGARAMSLAAAVCPVVPEPCVWLAQAARLRGEEAATRAWAAEGRKRLEALGTTWDKRTSYRECSILIDGLERPPVQGGAARVRPITPRDDEAGRKRFHRYVEALADPDGPNLGAIYPDLPSHPWHDPGDFPLVGYLASNFEEIRDEVLALENGRFHRESERIGRTGDWDVAFLYERGRRHDQVCAACPVTTRGIEAHSTVRTMAGLIYVSRMRAGTHIAPHRGPTNLRLRCHLGIEVPDGDCAIRVGDQARKWEQGRCLVFDDYFEHEAWNHTEEDRIVLIVDLWHPGLSTTEVALLEALHGYTYRHARRLSSYWAANASAAREAAWRET